MPWPLDEKHVIVSCKPSPQSQWGIYLVDVFDNMTLIHEVPGQSLFEPVVLQKQTPAPVIPDRTDSTRTDATVLLTDIYQGPGLEGVARGSVKKLRVVEYYYSMRGMGGLLGAVGMDGPWDIRRVLGTVPVEEDGSAHFTIPANTPVMVQPLDADGQALQTMRSWFTGMPGERVSCVGCHAGMNEAPPSAAARAAMKPPADIEATWLAPARVQLRPRSPAGARPPLHAMPRRRGRPRRTLPQRRQEIDDWSSQIAGNAGKDGGKFTASYAELVRYIRRPGIESDMRVLSPMDYHFSTTDLGRMLREGHHGVKLDRESFERIVTWADINAPFHGTWHEITLAKNERWTTPHARANCANVTPAPARFPSMKIPPLPPYDTTPGDRQAPR
jgi:hypothetical protein